MKWFQANKKKLIAGTAIVLVLAAAFWYGGNAPGLQGWRIGLDKQENPSVSESSSKEKKPGTSEKTEPLEENEKNTNSSAKGTKSASTGNDTGDTSSREEKKSESVPQGEKQDKSGSPDENKSEIASQKKESDASLSEKSDETTPSSTPENDESSSGDKGDAPDAPKQEIDPNTGKDKYQTDPVPEGKPIPVEPEDQEKSGKTMYCNFSISCSTILDNMDYCEEAKKECVPADGWILQPTTVAFTEGENVYDVLSRVCRERGIQMEASFTPMYNSVYIEGINNLYEFDVGSLSGWMYKVNEWFPNYGASRYVLQNGDVCCWVYTCDLGYDVGGGYAVGGN